ncbi:TetR/AcrR family transcriptional regulator [Pseudonocardia kunmingensis]|uniref:TetR family transcriptional regulator n=1 Tax=Pseudonocardia kunmingensis TaxID=630975 RepID=A0A543D0J9_9PSEU|nr:TetR/AcrR family transcriptional regulator [Pseudonocardia kunmingensis]TQM02879.1 TetR family transcriptional regulator [Pseudonocardia kunmingensis]
MGDGHEQRAQRILDAAAELVLRWGRKRVTIEEVAKHAGIGKGTVYLHFDSRARLFTCMLMRESLGLVDELTGAIERDPAAVLPSEQARLTYLGVHRRPLLRAMFLRDSDLLGDLAHEGAVQPLRDGKSELARDLFGLLRAHGLMRTDLDADTQGYVAGAVQVGFYLHQPAPGSHTTAPEAAAAALGHTLRAVLEPAVAPDPAALAAVAPEVLAQYRRFRVALAAAITEQPARAAGPDRRGVVT